MAARKTNKKYLENEKREAIAVKRAEERLRAQSKPIERRKPILKPAIKAKGGFDAEAFSKNGFGSFAGGGHVTFEFPNQSSSSLQRAAKLIRAHVSGIVFWQASARWVIKENGRRFTTRGFSPSQPKNRNNPKHIRYAILQSGVGAKNTRGLFEDYDKPASNLEQPTGERNFQIVLWFSGESRQEFIEERE